MIQKQIDLLFKEILENKENKDNNISSSLNQKEVDNIINHPLFIHLNLTIDEVNKYFNFFEKIIKLNEECKLLDRFECSDKTNHHLTVVRIDNRLYFYWEECEKIKESNKEIEHKENYIFNYYGDSEYSNLKFNTTTFGKQVTKSKNLVLKELYNIVQNKRKKGLYIYGESGVGKTFTVNAFANSMASKSHNKKVSILYMPEIPKLIMSTFNNHQKREEVDQLVEKITNSDLLILDDIGAENATDWFYTGFLLSLLNARCGFKDKITLFTSNLSLKELEKKYIQSCKKIDKSQTVNRVIDRIKSLSNNEQFLIDGQSLR